MLSSDCINVLALSETHLDSAFENNEFEINSYKLYRKDRNRFGGSVALYINDNMANKLCVDLMFDDMEIVWVQLHLLHGRPVLVDCCYRPTSNNMLYLERIC